MFKAILMISTCLMSSAYASKWPVDLRSYTPLSGKIWDTRARHFITPDQFIESTLDHDWLFIGENHENTTHHLIETALINHFSSINQLGNVAFEMANSSQQSLIDAHMGKAIEPEDIGWLPGWPWEWYEGPVTQAIKKAKRVLGVDLTREQQMTVYRDQPLALPEGSLREYMDNLLFESHCGMLPKEQLSNMLQVQIARDQAMAEIINTNASDQVDIYIAGSIHTRIDTGVPLYSNVDQVTLLLVAAGPSTDPSKYFPQSYRDQPVADYLLFTPEITPRDHCADFK